MLKLKAWKKLGDFLLSLYLLKCLFRVLDQLLQSQISSDTCLCLHIPTANKAELEGQMHKHLPSAQRYPYPMSPQSQARNLTVPVCDLCPARPKLHTQAEGQFQFKMMTDITTGTCLPWYISTQRSYIIAQNLFFSMFFHQWVQTEQPRLPVWLGWWQPHLLKKSYKTPIGQGHMAILFGSPLDATCAWADTLQRALFNTTQSVTLQQKCSLLHLVCSAFFSYFNVKLQRSLSHIHPHTQISAACKVSSNTKISACPTNTSRTSLSCDERLFQNRQLTQIKLAFILLLCS